MYAQTGINCLLPGTLQQVANPVTPCQQFLMLAVSNLAWCIPTINAKAWQIRSPWGSICPRVACPLPSQSNVTNSRPLVRHIFSALAGQSASSPSASTLLSSFSSVTPAFCAAFFHCSHSAHARWHSAFSLSQLELSSAMACSVSSFSKVHFSMF